MANVFLGIGVNFGVAGTTAITGSGIGTFTLQSQRHSKSAEKDVIKDANGTDTQATIYNPTEEATFEYFCTGAGSGAAITATTIPEIGAIVSVTNATQYPPLNQTTWFVWNDPEISSTNTTSFRVTLHLKRWKGTNGITAVTGA